MVIKYGERRNKAWGIPPISIWMYDINLKGQDAVFPRQAEEDIVDDHKRKVAEGFLFTDQYQLTMAQLYFRMGYHERIAQFDHFFRSYPDYGEHQAGYCISAGLEWFLDWLREAVVKDEDIECLRNQKGRTGRPIFDDDFLEWLRMHGSYKSISRMRSIPEGRVVHPDTPINVIQAPMAFAQLLESALLNLFNYQILIATKAARIRQVVGSSPVLEFGLRRAQDRGANAGARAALIGGANFTSNVGISHVLGYPPKGTHAHSMVQLFMALGQGELEAFQAYADVYPDDCLLLVDTVDTLESGVPNAIKVFERLRSKGHKPVGIRLDSGDLAYLSIQSAKMLNDAGFEDASIVLSNQLDELAIWQILSQIRQEASRDGVDADRLIGRLIYGVGTNLITSKGNPALDGVYKLVAVKDGNEWQPAIKVSETPAKVPNPSNKQLWRIYDKRGKAVADLMGLWEEKPSREDPLLLHHPVEHDTKRSLSQDSLSEIEPIHADIIRDGDIIYDLPSIEQMREAREKDLERLDPGVKRLVKPHRYHVSLTKKLWSLKQQLIHEAKGQPLEDNHR